MEDLKRKLQEEIAALENELRIELPKEILKARAHGDLRENAEYHAAKERQGFVNARLDSSSSGWPSFSHDRCPRSPMTASDWVDGAVLDLDKDEKIRYKLVTSEDADAPEGLISTTSPIGRGLLGKQVGDDVKIHDSRRRAAKWRSWS